MSDTMDAMKERWDAMEKKDGPAVTGITPHLVVSDGAAAVDFYTRAYGAVEHQRMLAGDGKRILNTALTINGGVLMLNDDFPEMRGGTATGAPAGVTLHLQVDDTDKWFDRAVAAGASVTMAPADMFWGDRYAQVKDPFGHSWAFGAPVAKR